MSVKGPFTRRRHKSLCPKCGRRYGVPVFYGQPTESTFRNIQIGNSKFGGPEKLANDPDKCCMKCGHTWIVIMFNEKIGSPQ